MARVTMASPALAVLLLLGLGAVHAAQDNYPSFFEVSSQALAGKASQRVRTLSSDGYGYSKMEQTCLEDTQIKNCRVTGCLSCADGIADGGSFQSDFDCCSKSSEYQHPNTNIIMTHTRKVAGCEWDFILYKENGTYAGDLFPTAGEGPYIKLGSATGRCHFNADSEDCDGLCDGMSVTMQGGLYVTLAYSKEPGNPIEAPVDDICASLDFVNDLNNIWNDGTNKRSASKRAGSGNRGIDSGTTAWEHLWRVVIEAIKETDFWARAEQELGPFTGGTPPPPPPPPPSESAKHPAPAPAKHSAPSATKIVPPPSQRRGLLEGSEGEAAPAAEIQGTGQYGGGGYGEGGYEEEQHEQYQHEPVSLNGGLAVVFMGETSVSSTKAKLKVEETGHLEYTPLFFAWARGKSYQYDYPLVKGGAMKLWLTEAEEKKEGYNKYEEQHGGPDHRQQ